MRVEKPKLNTRQRRSHLAVGRLANRYRRIEGGQEGIQDLERSCAKLHTRTRHLWPRVQLKKTDSPSQHFVRLDVGPSYVYDLSLQHIMPSHQPQYAFTQAAPAPRKYSSHGTSSALSRSAILEENWNKISDLAERRRIQSRIAQRNYRTKAPGRARYPRVR
jgi:hypothetical protein